MNLLLSNPHSHGLQSSQNCFGKVQSNRTQTASLKELDGFPNPNLYSYFSLNYYCEEQIITIEH
jgi:hypothetical protein